jgi:hypothetical protein
MIHSNPFDADATTLASLKTASPSTSPKLVMLSASLKFVILSKAKDP